MSNPVFKIYIFHSLHKSHLHSTELLSKLQLKSKNLLYQISIKGRGEITCNYGLAIWHFDCQPQHVILYI